MSTAFPRRHAIGSKARQDHFLETATMIRSSWSERRRHSMALPHSGQRTQMTSAPELGRYWFVLIQSCSRRHIVSKISLSKGNKLETCFSFIQYIYAVTIVVCTRTYIRMKFMFCLHSGYLLTYYWRCGWTPYETNNNYHYYYLAVTSSIPKNK